MNAKEYLLQIRDITARVKLLQREIESLRTEAEGISISLDGMPRGSGGGKDKTARLAILLAECETALTEEASKLWSKRIRIISQLGELKNPKHQQILHLRYVECKTWEVIAVEMDITWRYCYMLHGNALKEFEEIINK